MEYIFVLFKISLAPTEVAIAFLFGQFSLGETKSNLLIPKFYTSLFSYLAKYSIKKGSLCKSGRLQDRRDKFLKLINLCFYKGGHCNINCYCRDIWGKIYSSLKDVPGYCLGWYRSIDPDLVQRCSIY